MKLRLAWLPTATLALLLVASGCGGDDITDTTSSTSSSNVGGQGAGGSSGGSGGDGGTGVGGSGGASGDVQLMELWPLSLNKFWTFDVAALGLGGSCGPGTYTMQVQSMQMVNGRDAFMLTSWCSASGNSSFPYAWDTNGDLLYHFNNTWELTMANNVVDGATFMALGLPYMWRDVGSVTVPAGSFDDCWNVEQVGSVFYSTYCKDVGPVQHHYDDGGGNGWDAQLTMKN